MKKVMQTQQSLSQLCLFPVMLAVCQERSEKYTTPLLRLIIIEIFMIIPTFHQKSAVIQQPLFTFDDHSPITLSLWVWF